MKSLSALPRRERVPGCTEALAICAELQWELFTDWCNTSLCEPCSWVITLLWVTDPTEESGINLASPPCRNRRVPPLLPLWFICSCGTSFSDLHWSSGHRNASLVIGGSSQSIFFYFCVSKVSALHTEKMNVMPVIFFWLPAFTLRHSAAD